MSESLVLTVPTLWEPLRLLDLFLRQPLALDLVSDRARKILNLRTGGKQWRRWLKAWSGRAQMIFQRIWRAKKEGSTQEQSYGRQVA